MSWLYSSTGRIAWAIGSACVVVSLLVADWFARSAGWSPLAPSALALWVTVGIGMALGAFGALSERYLLCNRKDFLRTFSRAPLRERLTWRLQRENLRLNGWMILSLLALIGGCVVAGVFVLPALFAVNAVQFAFNNTLADQFGAEVRQAA